MSAEEKYKDDKPIDSCNHAMGCTNFFDKEDSHTYCNKWNLSTEYIGKMKDGTSRNLWILRDPDKNKVGYMITDITVETDLKNPWKHPFSFMEITMLNDRLNKFYPPKTSYSEYKKFYSGLE
jgi:hypothetical protein